MPSGILEVRTKNDFFSNKYISPYSSEEISVQVFMAIEISRGGSQQLLLFFHRLYLLKNISQFSWSVSSYFNIVFFFVISIL